MTTSTNDPVRTALVVALVTVLLAVLMLLLLRQSREPSSLAPGTAGEVDTAAGYDPAAAAPDSVLVALTDSTTESEPAQPALSAMDRALIQLNRLELTPEDLCAPYRPGDYRYSSSLENRLILAYGGIYDPFANEWYDSRDSVHIEHILARQEAHVSGLCAQSDQVKEQFSKDSLNLALVHYAINSSKGSRDAGMWLPEHNQCWFAKRIVDVKDRYNLSVDAAEHAALRSVLLKCASFELLMAPARHQDVVYGDTLSCGPYPTCSALVEDHPDGVSRYHCAYRLRLDGDKDGWACGN